MSFRLRRGLDSERSSIVFDEGELIYTTDTEKLYIGNGSTLGGVDFLNAGHNHDDLYYTKGQVDTLITNLGDVFQNDLDSHINDLSVHRTINDSATGITDLWSAQKITQELSSKSDTSHSHDELYYTEVEVDSLLQNLSDKIDEGKVKVDTDDVNSDTLINKIESGNGINIGKDLSSGDNKLLIESQVYITNIGGQPKPVYVDTSKGGKILSIESNNYIWMESNLTNNDWVEIGTARDADSGYIMPFDGTITGVTLHCENADVTKKIILWIDGAIEDADFLTINNGTNVIVNDQSKNIDFAAGSRFRLRASTGSNGGAGTIDDVVISVLVKWRP